MTKSLVKRKRCPTLLNREGAPPLHRFLFHRGLSYPPLRTRAPIGWITLHSWHNIVCLPKLDVQPTDRGACRDRHAEDVPPPRSPAGLRHHPTYRARVTVAIPPARALFVRLWPRRSRDPGESKQGALSAWSEPKQGAVAGSKPKQGAVSGRSVRLATGSRPQVDRRRRRCLQP